MEDEKKQVSGPNPEEAKKEAEETKPTETQSIPQPRFNEVYGKWKTAEEKAAALEAERDYYKNQAETPKVEEPKKKEDDSSLEAKFHENPIEVIREVSRESYKAGRREEQRIESQKASVEKVRERHPDLFNEDGSPNVSSEKFKIYDRIVGNKPRLMNDPDGPWYAMRDMEEELKVAADKKAKEEEAAKIQAAKEAGKKEGIQAEQKRDADVKGSYTVPAGAPKEEPKKVELSAAEKAQAAKMGLTIEDYAKSKEKKSTNKIMR